MFGIRVNETIRIAILHIDLHLYLLRKYSRWITLYDYRLVSPSFQFILPLGIVARTNHTMCHNTPTTVGTEGIAIMLSMFLVTGIAGIDTHTVPFVNESNTGRITGLNHY
jgi:hypothetical protein